MSDAISISGYILTSGDIAVSTIEKFDLENVGRGLYRWNFYHRCDITEDTGGGNFTPPPLDIKRCKKILGHRRVNNTIGPLTLTLTVVR